MHLKFNLQENNLSKINFMHDENIINSADLVMKIANITAITESSGIYHISEDSYSETENHISTLVKRINDFAHYTLMNWFVKSLATVAVTLLIFFLILKFFVK